MLNLQDDEAEQFVLGAMMVNAEIVPQVVDSLGNDVAVFHTVTHQLTYAAITKNYWRGNPTDPKSVADTLDKSKQLKRAGGIGYIYDLQARIVETESVIYYCSIILDRYQRRSILNRIDAIKEEVTELDINISDINLEVDAQSIHYDAAGKAQAIIPFPQEAYRGIFAEYRQMTTGRNEASDVYNFASLLTYIGAALGRRVFVDLAMYAYPNFYTVLVGPTYEAKKTTAMRVMRDNIHSTAAYGVKFLSGLASPEGLLKQFVDEETPTEPVRIFVFLSEFISLLQKAKKAGSEGLIAMLTDVYDCPPELNNPTRGDPTHSHRAMPVNTRRYNLRVA